MKQYKCPWCGNTKPSFVQDNGLSVSNPDLTLLCTARVKPEDSSFDHLDYEGADADQVGPDGLAECGYQWQPNQEDAS